MKSFPTLNAFLILLLLLPGMTGSASYKPIDRSVSEVRQEDPKHLLEALQVRKCYYSLLFPVNSIPWENFGMEELDEFIGIAKKAMQEHLRVEGGYGYEFYHGIRVMKICRTITKSEGLEMGKINKKCLLVAALFHDVGRVIDFDHHAEAGTRFVDQTLSHLLDENESDLVKDIIRQHCGDNKETIESRIVSDADCIDHVGAMDVWRMFHYSAFNKRDPTYTARWFEENKEWLHNHIKKLSFKVSKREMEERINSELRFMREFEREAECRLVD